MTVFENKKVTIKGNEETFFNLAHVTFNTSSKGLTLTQMRGAMKLMENLEKGEDSIELTDADVAMLKEYTEQMQWSIIDKGLIEFGDAIDAL